MMEHAAEYTPAFKVELNRRYASYKDGTAKMITPAESKKRLQKIMQSGKKK